MDFFTAHSSLKCYFPKRSCATGGWRWASSGLYLGEDATKREPH
jgi:hypothetical protein